MTSNDPVNTPDRTAAGRPDPDGDVPDRGETAGVGGELAGRVALVTGGGGAIGTACVAALVGEGASVVIADIDVDAARAVADGYDPDRVHVVAVDVRDPASVEAMVAASVERFGRLDVAVNNAGVARSGRLHETSLEDWEFVRSSNFDSVFHCLAAELRVMVPQGAGAIVNIASVMATVSAIGSAAYIASKHGVLGLTRAAAMDVAGTGVRVNAVGPGFVDTPLLTQRTRSRLDDIRDDHPVGRLGTSEEVAQVVLFLASPRSSFVTGAHYAVDGGYTTR